MANARLSGMSAASGRGFSSVSGEAGPATPAIGGRLVSTTGGDSCALPVSGGCLVSAASEDGFGPTAHEAGRVPLALHACCGPCSLEPVQHLREEGFEPTVLWCNPNIQPAAEHDLRLATLMSWARSAGVRVIRCERGQGFPLTSTPTIGEARELWERGVATHGFDREARCRACYAERLSITCRAARELGFTHISTTLAVSPYQLFDTCSEVLVRLARAHGLEPVVRDFRPFYPEATRESRELGMYRQNYCGCRFSAAEAAVERHERRDERKREKAAAKAARRAAEACAADVVA